MAINKSYSLNVSVVEKYIHGKQNYIDINKINSLSTPVMEITNKNWDVNLANGIIDGDIIIDGTRISPECSGIFEIANSFLSIDGDEFYSIDYKMDGATGAYIYKRENGNVSIHQKIDIIQGDITYLNSRLISIANINGSKDNTIHSEIINLLNGPNHLVDSSPEILIPTYIDQNRFFIFTNYFPIKSSYKILGYDTFTSSYIDIYSFIEKESFATGEILINKPNITSVKIFYFLAPSIVKNKNITYPISVNNEEYITIRSNDHRLYMPYNISSNSMLLDTGPVDYIELTPELPLEAIESSSRIVCNDDYGYTFNDNNVYAISPSTSIYDNVSESGFNSGLMTVDISYQEDINMVVMGIFSYTGYKRIVPISVGVGSLATEYKDLCTTATINTIGTNLETTNTWTGTSTNSAITYSFFADFDTYGYEFALPSIVDRSTMVIFEVDEFLVETPFLHFEVISPDILKIDKTKVKSNKTYKIEYTALASIAISTIDLYNKKAHILCTENPFTHYGNLDEIVLLTKKKVDIRFKDIMIPLIDRYFENSVEIFITPTSNYIKASLGEYKTLIY